MTGTCPRPKRRVITLAASTRWLPHALALAIVAYWLLVKSMLFHRLEYTSDLFSNLELTRSFFEGRPLLWENAYGDYKAFHNSYIAVLFYPLTRFLGAYGLFLAQAIFAGWAVHRVLRHARTAAEWRRELYWGAVAAMALGPVAFWIWDNPVYGFHFELLFLPLSVLFAVSLSERSRLAWIFGALIVITREEGPVVAWCIHVLYEVLSAETGMGDPTGRSRLFRRLGWITLAWLLMFVAGMCLLAAMGASHGRLGLAPSGARRWIEDSVRPLLLASLADAALLLLAGAVVYLAGIPLRGLIASALISLVLAVPLAIASSIYPLPGYHGFAWPPRFAMLWGVALVGCLFAIERARGPIFASLTLRRTAVALAVVASLVAQVTALRNRRDYDFLPRFTLQVFSSQPRFVASALSTGDDAFLSCLGRHLPRETPVAATGGLIGRFHQQDFLWPELVAIAWTPPELVVCDVSGQIPWEYGCLKLSRSLSGMSYNSLEIGNLSLRYKDRPKAVIEACVAKKVSATEKPSQRP